MGNIHQGFKLFIKAPGKSILEQITGGRSDAMMVCLCVTEVKGSVGRNRLVTCAHDLHT